MAFPKITKQLENFLSSLQSSWAGLQVHTSTAAAGAATIAAGALRKITTEALTTAAGATYTLTLTNTTWFQADSVVLPTVGNGTNTAGTPVVASVTPKSDGTCVIIVQNIHASAALNGTLIISILHLNAKQ